VLVGGQPEIVPNRGSRGAGNGNIIDDVEAAPLKASATASADTRSLLRKNPFLAASSSFNLGGRKLLPDLSAVKCQLSAAIGQRGRGADELCMTSRIMTSRMASLLDDS